MKYVVSFLIGVSCLSVTLAVDYRKTKIIVTEDGRKFRVEFPRERASEDEMPCSISEEGGNSLFLFRDSMGKKGPYKAYDVLEGHIKCQTPLKAVLEVYQKVTQDKIFLESILCCPSITPDKIEELTPRKFRRMTAYGEPFRVITSFEDEVNLKPAKQELEKKFIDKSATNEVE